MRKELLLSIARKALIVLLLATAVLLFLQTDYFSASERRRLAVSGDAAGDGGDTGNAAVEAAAVLRPRAVLVRLSDGGAAASAYDGETTENAFRRFAALLGEALGSAGAPEEVPESEFRAGLDGECVFVDPGVDCPLDLLSDWLGAGGGGAAARSADILYLGLDGDTVSLCFRGAEDGRFYRCATAAQADALRSRIADFESGEAYFAYESELLRGAEAYTVLLKTLPAVYVVSGGSAREYADAEQLMDAVGMNSFLASSYYDADGTLVLMEAGRTLRLRPDGAAVYRNTAGEAEFAAGDTAAATDRAIRLAEQSIGAFCGDAELRFAGAESREDAYTVYFDYCVNDIPVRLSDGHAAEIVVSGGTVRDALLRLRRYTRSEELGLVLPMLQAAAVAAERGGAAPALVYMDSGDSVRCEWVNQ